MSFFELFLLTVGLSMDAFAVAICSGLTMKKLNVKKSIIIGLYFGIFQAVMPVIGYLIATLFAELIITYDHWVAFILLVFLGMKMIIESLKKEGCSDRECPETVCTDRKCKGRIEREKEETSVKPSTMLPLAIATSIDALAVGVSFAFIHVSIVPAVSFIGVITFTLSVLGVKIGNVFGMRYKSKAEVLGGIILILIGLKILLEHLGIINF